MLIAVVVAALIHLGSRPATNPRPSRAAGLPPSASATAPPAAPPTTERTSRAPKRARRSPAPQPTRKRARPSPHPRPSPRLDKVISCPAEALLGVYHPYRLHVLGACRWFSGRVTAVRHEDDGDYHVDIAPAPGEARFLDRDNYSEQYGSLVTEIMPGQDLVVPFVGEEVKVLGTWVYDADHGWNEIHPIWAIGYPDGKVIRSLPPATPVYRGTAPKPKPKPRPRPTRSSGGVGSNCTPGYSPCLVWHGGADYDCYGGGGNGPYFTAPGVVYQVTGSDPYRLDSNGNGLGCE